MNVGLGGTRAPHLSHARPLAEPSSKPGDARVAQACGLDTAVAGPLAASLRGLQVMGHATFGGKVGSRAVGMLEREVPRGDWRDLRQVRAWARQIAEQVLAPAPSAGQLRASGG